ncbi:hypothetical protein SAMN06297129_3243 [Pseudooceanicola antarcticus]|nr:hypothetical protein [Pseudooceanicola antarcticus]SNY56273.1 hypothetical protein SAMN06297129_3243 [Pseudooceanicola antarcticus]
MPATLPRKVQEVTDEVDRIKEKIRKIEELGGDPEPLKDYLGEYLPGVIKELDAEARTEIRQLLDAAVALNHGIRGDNPANARDPKIEANEDIRRIDEAEAERKRIREKLKIARQHIPPGDAGEAEQRLADKLEGLDKQIRKAAQQAAEREIEELEDELEAIARGRPRKGAGVGPGARPKAKPADPPDKAKDDKDNRSGGGGGSGAPQDIEAGDTGVRLTPGQKSDINVTLSTIYVASETDVWVWDPRSSSWEGMGFGGELVKVEIIDGGLLAFSAGRAALWDSYRGEWLPVLEASGLEEGEAKVFEAKA